MARTVVVVWRPSPECNCGWDDLFEPHPNLQVTDGSRPPVPPGVTTLEVCQPIEALAQWRHVAQVCKAARPCPPPLLRITLMMPYA